MLMLNCWFCRIFCLQVFQVLTLVQPEVIQFVFCVFGSRQTDGKQFGAKIFWRCPKVPKIESKHFQKLHNNLRGPATAFQPYSELESIFREQFGGVLMRICAIFWNNWHFSAIFGGVCLEVLVDSENHNTGFRPNKWL